MPTATAGNGGFTPSLSLDNWTLDYSVNSGSFGKVIAIGWGGRSTASTAFRTRWTRPTTSGYGTAATLTSAFHQPNYGTLSGRAMTFNTVAILPADPGGNLWAQDWNSQGGLGMIVMPLANPWWVVNSILTGQISCRNILGTEASTTSYEVTFEE